MKKKILLLMGVFSFSILLYAQVGINTTSPKALLHIQESSAITPTGIDGILLPTVRNFPVVNPDGAGNIVYLKKNSSSTTTQPDGFYYWNGSEWLEVASKSTTSEEFRNLYCAFGQGYEGNNNDMNYRPVSLSQLIYDPAKEKAGTVFSLANNAMTVGKAGTYLVSFVTSSRRYVYDGSGTEVQQTNLLGEVLLNGAPFATPILAKGNTSAEQYSATHIVVNVIVTLAKNDKISARVRLTDRFAGVVGPSGYYQPATGAPPSYTSNGISSLTLIYLHK